MLQWQHWRVNFRNVPLLGPLADCSWRDHWETMVQTFLILLFSTAPLWLGSLVIFATSTEKHLPYIAAFVSTINDGQLFMYCTALLAPVVWMALVDPPGARVFPSKIAHIVLVVVIDLIASVFFALIVAAKALIQPFTFRFSIELFAVSLVLLYLGTVYHSSRLPDAAGEFKKEEKDFSEVYEEHRK